jgi:DNA polymerase elongation subunit (family B)
MDLEPILPKKTPDFCCEKCAFISSNRKDYMRHLSTRKHVLSAASNQLEPILPKKTPEHKCSQCSKVYYSKSGLWNHRKKCIKNDCANDVPIQHIEKQTEQNITEGLNVNTLVLDLLKQNNELQKQLVEMSKQTHVINNTTNNNTQNNQFNLNVFLNEECKDAINIVDFVESLKITVNDLEQTGHLGYVQGITRIFVQALKQLDVTMRPLHCTDIKRETVYIKDQDNWEKENNEKTKLRNVLKKIARKNLKMLPEWQEQNPDFRYLDTRENNEFIQISLNSLGPESREEQERQEDKIIRNVLKEIVIDKTRKSIE